jgi:hypothetical protein
VNGPAVYERQRKGRNTKNMMCPACPHDCLRSRLFDACQTV